MFVHLINIHTINYSHRHFLGSLLTKLSFLHSLNIVNIDVKSGEHAH